MTKRLQITPDLSGSGQFGYAMHRLRYPLNAILPIALVLIAIFLLSAFTPQELIRDSASWAGVVESGHATMWHPHHLLCMPINRLFLHGISTYCNDCNAVDAGQLHSAIWAIVMVLAVYYLIRHLTGQPVLGFALSLLLLTSQSIWVLALQPQAYAPLIGTLALLFAFLFMTKTQAYSLRWALAVSALYGPSP